MKGILRKIGKHKLLPVVFSVISLLAASLIVGYVTSFTIAIFSLVCGLQFITGKSEKLEYYLSGLEVKETSKENLVNKYEQKINFAASLVPLLTSQLGLFVLPIVLLYIAISLIVAWPVILKLFNRKKIRAHAVKVLEAERPTVAVYVTGMKGVAYQINQWLPVLEKLDQPVIIILREADIFSGMLPTNILTVTARTQIDLEAILGDTTSVKKVLYPANTMKNVQALRYHHLDHIFINHGESDKAVNQSKLLMAYDYLFVAGPLSEERLRAAGLPLREGQVIHVGRPQAEMALNYRSKVDKIETILYAPTWEGYVKSVDYSSIGELGYKLCVDIINDKRYNLIFKPHPYTGAINPDHKYWLNEITKLCVKYDIKIYSTSDSIHDAMNLSDILICDISSVMNEYLVTGKPIILCNTQELTIESLNIRYPTSCAATIVNENVNIIKTISEIEGEDKVYEQRLKSRKYSLGDFEVDPMMKFLEGLD
ncbi:CDP-glycerol glycerophosphotransferase family protein [Cobetia sp. 29-18-1]|uniref:CDP-glycerol glycerophosphotransferase family protein n=1 Tax=Cobetia sp. 29-18-1 TaxID=3040018 RepID=UPI0024479F2C|nr:CDP-glycerol glycerophosphotransferase family protein [Cobetia sp. 29-18-1]MDH2299245.1 CDP-glycerol glycerophosphotransferase family protein [Cobetia sp. 29-18-1]